MKQPLLQLAFGLVATIGLAQPVHTFSIHANGRVASCQMTSTEYADWKSQDQFYYNSAVRQALFQDVYEYFDDDFDFIFLVLNEDAIPSGISYAGLHIGVSNAVQGIGQGIYSQSALYGSAGKLKGVMQLPRRDLLEYGPSLHELAHQWANFGIPTQAVNGFGTNLTSFSAFGHWGYTGGSTKGQLGGFQQSTLVDNGNNSYTVGAFGWFANGGNSIPYTEMERYLMGMIPLASVAPFDAFANITSATDNGATYTFTANTRTTHTPTSIQTLLGSRVPSSTTSQKDFKLLVLVLTDTPLTTAQWDLVDGQSYRFGLPGDNGNYLYNFWEATNHLGTMETSNLFASLPIELISLDATIEGEAVKLNWETATESNSARFEVERSADGQHWEAVTAVAGAGNSVVPHSYGATDRSPLRGMSYYRLKQVDLDGSFSLSKTVSVRIADGSHLSLYPMPVLDELFIENEGRAALESAALLDGAGREVLRQTATGERRMPVDLSAVEPGVYFLRAEFEDRTVRVEKVVVTR